MRNSFICGVGGVVSADIAVPEHEREVAFYSKVLTTGEEPLWREDLMNNLGMPIIGLGEKTPEYEFLPLQWMPHFQVADVANSVEKALEKGGKELIHSKTEDGQSQWAGLTDPDGAGFGIIPVVSDDSYNVEPNARIGDISWLTLFAKDASVSCDFYQHVIGWDPRPCESNETGSSFEMMTSGENSAAEIREAGNANNIVPAVWLLHLPVAELAKSLNMVTEHGGEVVKEGICGDDAVIRDPVGVHFALSSR